MFLVCLNLAVFLAVALGVPGVTDVNPNTQGQPMMDTNQYEEHFNASDIRRSWDENIVYGIPILGDIFAGFAFIADHWQFLIDGFPIFLNWVSANFITDASASTAFGVFANVLRAIYAILMAMWFIEFISGRFVTD